MLVCNGLDGFGTPDQAQRNEVGDGKVLNLARVVQTDDGVSLHQETEHDDAHCPYVNGARLLSCVEDGLRRHITLRACAVLDVHFALQVSYLFDHVVIRHLERGAVLVGLDLR